MTGDFEAILFDLDGTLIDTEPAAARAVEECFKVWNIRLDGHDSEYVTGRTWQSALDFLFKKYCPALLHDPHAHDAAIREIMKRYRTLLDQSLPTVPGAVEAVRALHAHYKMAVVSGSSRQDIEWALRKLGVFELFEFVLGAEDYERGKPDPMPYLKAIHTLNVPARKTLIFEDSLAGISAARAAKAFVVAISGTNHFSQDISKAHDTISDLTPVNPEWIQDLAIRIMK